MTKKQQLYYLLEKFMEGNYDIDTFCDELTLILYYESGGVSELNDYERKHFIALADVAERYSPYEEEHDLEPKAFKTEEEVRKAIFLAYSNLIKK